MIAYMMLMRKISMQLDVSTKKILEKAEELAQSGTE